MESSDLGYVLVYNEAQEYRFVEAVHQDDEYTMMLEDVKNLVWSVWEGLSTW